MRVKTDYDFQKDMIGRKIYFHEKDHRAVGKIIGVKKFEDKETMFMIEVEGYPHLIKAPQSAFRFVTKKNQKELEHEKNNSL
jgi:hypothetical protein